MKVSDEDITEKKGGMMLVLGLDLETTGLDVATDEIIEVGAVMWDTDRKLPVKMYSEMVQIQNPLSPEITKITGITHEDLATWGVSAQEACMNLEALVSPCQYIVAHNGLNFDKLFIDRYLEAMPDIKIDLPWIDTMTDLPYPKDLKIRKLSYVAAEHGFLNPFVHRSLFDVLTMLKVFSSYPINEIIEFSNSPMVRVVAHVSFEEKDKAKRLGFRWDPTRREWFSGLREAQAKKSEYPFPISCETL